MQINQYIIMKKNLAKKIDKLLMELAEYLEYEYGEECTAHGVRIEIFWFWICNAK